MNVTRAWAMALLGWMICLLGSMVLGGNLRYVLIGGMFWCNGFMWGTPRSPGSAP